MTYEWPNVKVCAHCGSHLKDPDVELRYESYALAYQAASLKLKAACGAAMLAAKRDIVSKEVAARGHEVRVTPISDLEFSRELPSTVCSIRPGLDVHVLDIPHRLI